MITEAELYNDKWRACDNGFYKLGIYIIPDRTHDHMWRLFIEDEQGSCLMRSPYVPFKDVAHLERVIKWHIQEIVFDPVYPVLKKLSPKLKRTLKNWIL